MGRWRLSFSLFGLTWRVLRDHRSLMAFPLVSLAASLVVLASFGFPVFAVVSRSGHPDVAGYVIAFCGYVVLSCVTVFCNAALIHSANVALGGGRPTFRDGFAAAYARKGPILGWGAFSGTVSLVLRIAEQRLGPLGRFVALLGGLAWSLVTYLVLPLIVLEGDGVKDSIKRSPELFRRRWGSQVSGIVGVGLVSFLLLLLAFPILGVAAIAGGTAGLITGLVLAGAWVLFVIVLSGALTGIFQTALYRYAADGVPPGGFDAALLAGAMRQRRRRRFS